MKKLLSIMLIIFTFGYINAQDTLKLEDLRSEIQLIRSDMSEAGKLMVKCDKQFKNGLGMQLGGVLTIGLGIYTQVYYPEDNVSVIFFGIGAVLEVIGTYVVINSHSYIKYSGNKLIYEF